MKLEGYTPEIFLENFINDSEVFGEETAKAIYEEIFSTICRKKVKLDCFTEALNESLDKVGDVEVFLETPADAQIIKTGFLSKIGKFITSLPLKVKEFFGGLKGKSFSEIMKQGMAWLQANPMIALKTTGGIALVALLIRALKKRGQLNKYKQLQAIYNRGQALKEDIEENSLEAIAINKIIEECKTNKALNNLIFGEEKMESKKSYFAY